MITIKIKRGTKITFTILATGEISSMILSNNTIHLIRGRMYCIPVNTEETFDNNNYFKIKGNINEMIDIRNINNGIASIVPIIHNSILKDEDELGIFL